MKIKGKQLSDTLRSSSSPFTEIHSSQFTGDLDGGVKFKCKNGESFALTKGQCVYISGVSGDIPLVKLSDADDASTMPSIGLTTSAANVNAEVYIVSFGNLTALDTASLGSGIVGDNVYVSTTPGAVTVAAPSGSSSNIQNIGQIVREHATAGIIRVGGAGRVSATPNLDQGKFFVGNASNKSSESAYTLPTSDGSANQVLETDGSGAVSFSTLKSVSLLAFGQNDPLTDETNPFEMGTAGGSQNTEGYRMPLAGEVTHITIQARCTSSSNTVIVYLLLFVNGSQVGSPLGTTVSSTGNFGNTFTLSTAQSFSAGDRLTLKVYHNQTGATTQDHAATLRVISNTY